MKRLFTAVMVGLLCVSFAACGQTQQSQERSGTQASDQQAAQVQSMSGDDLTALLKDEDKMKEVLLVDARDANDYASGHIDGAQNIFVDDMESKLSELEGYKDKQVVLYCNTGNKSGKAADILVKNGFKNVYNAEGVKQYEYELVQ